MIENKKPGNQKLLLQYAGLTVQLLAALGIAVFAGIKLDDWLHIRFPVFVCALPLAVLIILMIKVIKDTSNK